MKTSIVKIIINGINVREGSHVFVLIKYYFVDRSKKDINTTNFRVNFIFFIHVPSTTISNTILHFVHSIPNMFRIRYKCWVDLIFTKRYTRIK